MGGGDVDRSQGTIGMHQEMKLDQQPGAKRACAVQRSQLTVILSLKKRRGF